MRTWRPMLRLARRDARRHPVRTLLAALLIALPVAALSAFISVSNPGSPPREQALDTIPTDAQAVITATTIPTGGPPFAQLPEGAPGSWMDDPDTPPASRDQIAAELSPGSELAEFWLSPPLMVSPDLKLAPGETKTLSSQADELSDTALEQLAMVELRESEALEKQAPKPIDGALPTNPTEVLVSQAVANRLDVAVGDSLGFVAPPDSGVRSTDGNAAAAMQDSARGYLVSGITDSDQYVAWAPAGWLSELVAAQPLGVQGHWLVLGTEPVTWQQAKSLNQLQAFAVSRHVLEHYPSESELYPTAVDPAKYIEGAIGVVLTLVVGALLVLFLVTPALAISAEQSRRTLGLAIAAGATPRDLKRTVLAQGLVIGTLGGLIGAGLGLTAALGFGAWLGSLEANNGTQSFGVQSALANFPWWAAVAGVVVAVLLGIIAALGPARSAEMLNPVEALRQQLPKSTSHRIGRASLVWGCALLGLSVVLGTITLAVPAPTYPSDAAAAEAYLPGTPPPGSGLLVLLVGLAVLFAALGLALTIRGLLPKMAALGRGRRPIWRLALRDAADHPSRTVPAVLGVTFSLLAASYVIVLGASTHADGRTTGETIDWRGTFLVAPQTPISPKFDEALAAGALAELSQDTPQITGGHRVEAVSSDSTIRIEALLPEGESCPDGQEVDAASARTPGGSLKCVSYLSGAAYRTNYRFGSPFATWDAPVLMDSEALLATRLPDAEAAAEVLSSGGVLVSNAALVDDEGMVRLGIGSPTPDGPTLMRTEQETRLPAMFMRGMGVGLVMSPDAAFTLGVDQFDFVGLLAETTEPLDDRTLGNLARADIGDLANVNVPDSRDPLGAPSDAMSKAMVWGPIVLLVLVAVAAATISVLLSVSRGRQDADTARAIGASPTDLAWLRVAKTVVILGIGIPIGLGAGIALASYQVAWNRHLASSGAWLDTVPVWGAQAIIAVTVAVTGVLAALILTRSLDLRRRLH